jgi:hypothetical protein
VNYKGRREEDGGLCDGFLVTKRKKRTCAGTIWMKAFDLFSFQKCEFDRPCSWYFWRFGIGYRTGDERLAACWVLAILWLPVISREMDTYVDCATPNMDSDETK